MVLAWSDYPTEVRQPNGAPLFLKFDQAFQIVPHPTYKGERKLLTRAYFYGVCTSQDADPILYWHWNPEDKNWPYPHLHAPVADPAIKGMRLHIPTGQRVTIEQVLGFLICEVMIKPVHENWEADLKDGQRRFEIFQTQDETPKV